jgi:hypothetical protein
MTTTATQRRIQRITGDSFAEVPVLPATDSVFKFLAHAPGAYDALAGSDDLSRVLELAWEGYRMSEQPAYVWDRRGDGADFDPTAEPRLLAVVGVFWLDEED